MKKILLFLFVNFVGIMVVSSQNIADSTILRMVKKIQKLNFLDEKGTIYPGQLLLCEFPDNNNFQFYQEVLPGENLWVIAKNLLVITSDYHMLPKNGLVPSVSEKGPKTLNNKEKNNEYELCQLRSYFIICIFLIILMIILLRRWNKICK